MLKRILIFFIIIVFGIFIGIFRIYYWSFNGNFRAVKNPLVNESFEQYCVVFPSIDVCNSLSEILSQEELLAQVENLNSGKPFCVKIGKEINISSKKGLRIFKIPRRYSENKKQIAPHVIGYLNSAGEGVCAIEKSFDNYLKKCTGEININYKKDALGKIFSNNLLKINDFTYKHRGGVVLTIDKKIQRIVHEIAKEKIKKGAIIVASVKNFEIKSLVSMPEYDPNKVAQSINEKDSPFLNRALQSYNAGSVFKLVTSMALLENNIEGLENYNCEASIVVGDSCFHCARCRAHGIQNLKEALSNSCNTYFINFIKTIEPEKFYNFCKNLGFGEKIKLAEDVVSEKGYLPSPEELKDPNEMAHISFGQGKLMVTPLQILSLINTIANNGEYSRPMLVLGLVNHELKFLEKFKLPAKRRVISKKTADEIKKGMILCTESGTGSLGKVESVKVCAKTSTAQTGIKTNVKNVLQGWFAGFFPAENPKYSVLVMLEDVESGGADCGPIFKEIIEKIIKL